ncbi:peptide deformylase, partial [Photobacterium sagamiensis]|uniref:peptide deformylase n=1 Tax=Photobacterium sagamiensis TaxID=2910241 RepID=UPI003D0CEC29
MAVLEVLTIPNQKLKIQASEVKDISQVQQLIEDMLETMYSTDDGIGLAATQVGRTEAIVVIDISQSRNEPLVLVNPIIESGDHKEIGQEGCLSVPGYYADVERLK